MTTSVQTAIFKQKDFTGKARKNSIRPIIEMEGHIYAGVSNLKLQHLHQNMKKC